MSPQPAVMDWIGRREEREDVIAPHAAIGLTAALDRDDPPAPGDPLPPTWHWLYFADYARQSRLGPDGHAARGEFLPPVALPRRMWGGNRLDFHKPLRIGERVRRVSEILSIREKEGRSGPLALVTVKHGYYGPEGLALEERHDIVYRAETRGGNLAPPGETPSQPAQWRREIDPDPVLLFRYSALTFNGHRIHYDQPYVTEVEGYPGLIVHGPLTATLLLDLLRRERPDAVLASVTFRARRPLYSGARLTVEGAPNDGGCRLWACDPSGAVAMTAAVTFA